MERYWIENGILAPNECGGLVKYADAQATVEALQRERDEAVEAAARPTWVCDGCGRVSQEGWINHTIECLDGTEYEMECPVCGVRVIEEDCASDLARERDDLQTALDAERAKVPGYETEIRNAYKEAADWQVQWKHAQHDLTQLQALVRAFIEAWDHDGEPNAVAYEGVVERARATLGATTPAKGK